MRQVLTSLVVSWPVFCVLTVPVAAEVIKPPPTVKEVDLDRPFNQVYAGNKVVVTMQAEAPNGISKGYMRIVTQNGISMLEGLELTATDKPGQVRGEFTVPAVQSGSDKPLPKGSYVKVQTELDIRPGSVRE